MLPLQYPSHQMITRDTKKYLACKRLAKDYAVNGLANSNARDTTRP
jgi:hypothetical protein